ncbi:MAG: type II toxin-antitoxin system MqsA family antitoxin [SAR324 cluster bacterium]|nr:type II toxin-antitoxin system MqsA family antitoxin [SAR324 cluster bacterium]
MNIHKNACPLCGGTKTDGKITFTVDLKETLVVVRDVPATICSLCGNEWLSDDIAASLELIVSDAKTKSHLVEITNFPRVA